MRDDYEERVERMMSRHTAELLERVPYVRPLALHGLCADHYRDALGLPFPLDAAYLDSMRLGHSFNGHHLTCVPFRGPYLGPYDCSFEPAFIRKRNERERQRVRCVNEGYARLRECLPREAEDKRRSKAETLRAAIHYINHLQGLLGPTASSDNTNPHSQRSDGESQTQAQC